MFKLLATAIARFTGTAAKATAKVASKPLVITTAAVTAGTVLSTEALKDNLIDPLKTPLFDPKTGITTLSFVLIVAAIGGLSFIALKAFK